MVNFVGLFFHGLAFLLLVVNVESLLLTRAHASNLSVTMSGKYVYVENNTFVLAGHTGLSLTDNKSSMFAVNDHTGVIVNNTHVIGLFNGTVTVIPRSSKSAVAEGRMRRSLDEHDDNYMVRSCRVNVYFTSEFIAKMYSYSSAQYFAELVVYFASGYYKNAFISSNYVYILEPVIIGMAAVPHGLSPADSLDWVSMYIPTDGCINALFAFIPDEVVNGIASVDGACNAGHNWVVINTLDLASAMSVLAHEVGHSFGAPHDNITCEEGHIMQPVLLVYADTFSECSLAVFRQTVPLLDCLVDGVARGKKLTGSLFIAFNIIVVTTTYILSFVLSF